MNIIGFSGKSGSGKSFKSIELCAKYNIEAMIDDGLLIRQGLILAGISAKKQSTRMGAVKTAIFTDEKHCEAVKKAINEADIQNLMVIGTSDRMVDKICERLEIGKASRYIHIEEVSTPKQIEKAHREREEKGIHTIPALTIEVKKQFSGYFLDPRKSFRKDEEGKEQCSEKTVVRPSYSYLGNFEISSKVISDIIQILAKKYEFLYDILWDSSDMALDGMYIRFVIRVKPGFPVLKEARKLQKEIYDTISHMTAFNIIGIEIEIKEFKDVI